MRYLLIAIFMLPALLIAEDKKKTELPSAVLKAVKLHETKCDKAEQAYLAAVQKSQDALVKSLDSEIKRATRKGDLDGALAIKALKEKTVAEGVATDMLGNLITPKSEFDVYLIGVWTQTLKHHKGKTVTFTENGTWQSTWPHWKGTWKVENGKLLMTNTVNKETQSVSVKSFSKKQIDLSFVDTKDVTTKFVLNKN